MVNSEETDTRTKMTLPRLGFHFTGLSYDPERKINPMHKKYLLNPDNSASFYYAPIPYNWDFQLYAAARTSDDGLQITEQILPYFQPEYTVGIKLLDNYPTEIFDVPFVLSSTSYEDTYEGDMESPRSIIWTFTFVAKGYLFLPIANPKLINRAIVTIRDGANPCQDRVTITTSTNPSDAKPGESWEFDIDITEFLGEGEPVEPEPPPP
jgi:hypothetical protein